MAKRVNKKFLIILTCGVMGPILVAVFAAYFLRNKSATQFIAAAESHYAKQEYEQAWENYVKAYGRSPGNASLLIKQGDCLSELCRTDPERMSKFMTPWELALEIEPMNVEALKRLYESAKDLSEVTPQGWEQLRIRAEKYLKADPSLKTVEVMMRVADVNAWLRAGKAVPEIEVKSKLDELAKLMESNPTETIIPQTIAESRIRLARESATNRNTPGVSENCIKAREIVDKAVESQPQHAGMHYRRYAVYRQMSALEPERSAEWAKIASDSLGKAAFLTANGQADHIEIRMAWSQKLLSEGKPDEAKATLKELLEQHPESNAVILSLAEFLRVDPKTRPEAIKLLSQVPPDDGKVKGFLAQKRINGEFARMSLLTMIQIDSWPSTDVGERAGLKQLIDDNISKLKKAGRTNPLTLKAEGSAMLLDPETHMAGIQVLTDAVDQTEALKGYDTDLYYRLAQAYLRVPQAINRQTGQAVKLLSRVLEIRPGDILARQLLIKVLNDERRYDQALKNINFLIDNKIELPGLTTDRITALVGSGNFDKARELVNALPEGTYAERLTKASMADNAKMTVVADNLLRRLNQEELSLGSKDYPGTISLARSLIRDRKREEANTVVRTALQKDPQNPQLKRLGVLLDGETDPDKIFAGMGGTDDATREVEVAIQKATLRMNQGDYEKAIESLVEMEKRYPGNIPLLTAIFGSQMDVKKFEDAEKTAKRLETLNADQASGLTYRAQLKIGRQDFEGALKDAMELTSKLDSFAISWVLKGQAQQGLARRQRLEDDRMKTFEASIVSYTRALECQADNFQALRGLIDCHLAINQESIAKELIRRGSQGSQSAYFIEQGRRLEELRGDPRTVTAIREKAVEENPSNSSMRMALIENYGSVSRYLRGKGDAAGNEAMVSKIQKTLEDAVKQWPDDLTFANRLAQVLSAQKKHSEAMAVLSELAKREEWKDRPQPSALMAQYALASGNRTQAESLYLQALKISKDGETYQQMLLNFYLQNNLVSKGLDLLKTMVDKSQSAELRTRYVSLLIANKESDKAEEICRKAIEKDSSDLESKSLMALIRMSSGRQAEASQLLEDALKVNPRHSRSLHYRGVLKTQKNDIAGAVMDLTSARLNSPESADIRQSLSDALLQRGDTEAAATELEDAIRYNPTRDDLRLKLVNIYFSQERWTDVKRQLDDALQSGESASDAVWWKLTAKMWISRNNMDNAMSAALSAAALNPNDPEISFYILEINYRKKQYSQVVDLTGKVIESDGEKTWWLYMHRGRALWAMKREPEAKTAFEMAMGQIDALQSSDAAEQLTREMANSIGLAWVHEQLAIRKAPYWMLCDMRQYIAAGEIESGIRIADKFTDEFMRDFTPEMTIKSRIYIGETLTLAASKGNERAFRRAIEVYNAVLKDADRLTTVIKLQVLNNLAFLYSDGSWKDYAKGLGYSEQAYDLMRKVNYINPTIADTHGWLLVLNNQIPTGIALLQSVVDRDSSFPDAHYHLAEGYFRNKQYVNARVSLDKAKDALAKAIASEKIIEPTLEAKIKDLSSRIDQATRSDNNGNPSLRP